MSKDELSRVVEVALNRICYFRSLVKVEFSPPEKMRVIVQWEIPEEMRTYVVVGAPPEFIESVKVIGVWLDDDSLLRVGELDLWELDSLCVEAKAGQLLRINLQSSVAGSIFCGLGRLSRPCKSDTKPADCN